MLRSHFDHLVITAPTLAAGVDYVSKELGATLQQGGEHASMGTHNFLLKLGDASFLEVIAVNPDVPPPRQARWFELDEPESNETPRLATWVVRTDDVKAALVASPVVSGYVMPMSRGALNWMITVPRNGSLPLQGVAPTMIQWQVAHPAVGMKDSGCSLIRLEGFHPRAEKVTAMLKAIGFQGDFSVSQLAPGEQPYLVAHIQTPGGVRQLSGRAV